MFLGEFRHSIDSKNRLFIPAKFREELGESFVIVRLLRGKCLRIFSAEAWDRYLDPIRALARSTGEDVMNNFSRNAAFVSPDSQGRVVVPAHLIKKVDIEKNVVILGCTDYAEIWAEDAYEDMIANENEAAMLALLESMGL